MTPCWRKRGDAGVDGQPRLAAGTGTSAHGGFPGGARPWRDVGSRGVSPRAASGGVAQSSGKAFVARCDGAVCGTLSLREGFRVTCMVLGGGSDEHPPVVPLPPGAVAEGAAPKFWPSSSSQKPKASPKSGNRKTLWVSFAVFWNRSALPSGLRLELIIPLLWWRQA